MIRALGYLLGGLGRFLPCRIGANHCRLRSIGWESCGHGLTSGPLEASDAGFLDDLLFLFGCPIGSGQSLVDGSLRMRYCSAKFSCKKPTWRLLRSGGVAALVYAASLHPMVAGSPGSGDTPSCFTDCLLSPLPSCLFLSPLELPLPLPFLPLPLSRCRASTPIGTEFGEFVSAVSSVRGLPRLTSTQIVTKQLSHMTQPGRIFLPALAHALISELPLETEKSTQPQALLPVLHSLQELLFRSDVPSKNLIRFQTVVVWCSSDKCQCSSLTQMN